MKSWNVNWWSNIIVNYFDDGIHDLSCLLTMSVTNNIYLCSWPLFLKFSLYIQLASQLSRGVLIDISCTNCDNVSSHCHIMFTGTWSRSVTIVTSVMCVWWRNVQRTEGGDWLLGSWACLCLRSKTQAGAHWSLQTVPTMHRRNSGAASPGPRAWRGTRLWSSWRHPLLALCHCLVIKLKC